MTEVNVIGAGAVDRLWSRCLNLMLELKSHMLEQQGVYRLVLDQEEKIKHTLTTAYITCTLTSIIAKLFFLKAYMNNEIDLKLLSETYESMIKDMPIKPTDCLFIKHTVLNKILEDAEELNTRVDNIASGAK